ncbi:MAG: ATPase, T2SS/T4P/T4SS family [Phycisphaeraceae bacterium]
MAYLEVHLPDGPTRVALDAPKITIGRHPKNHVCLGNDGQASRYHCELEVQGERVILRDLGSSNGTYIGNERITEQPIDPGTIFHVGSTAVRLVDDDGAQTPETADDEPTKKRSSRRFSWRGLRGKSASAEEEAPAPTMQTAPSPEPAPGTRGDFAAGSVEALAHVGQDVPYDEHQVALINARGDVVHTAGQQSDKQETAAAVRILRLVLLACIRSHASDVHIEPREGGGAVRLRVDGTMVQACRIDEAQTRRILSLIKVLADLDITRRTGVQEGHFTAEAPDRRIDYRVSFTPSMYGQKLVLRVLDPLNSPRHFEDMGLPENVHQSLSMLAGKDTGMLLAAGPTGSGKTTTLYAVLRAIDAQQRNVITIEDPIEYALAGATQIPVDNDEGHTFDALLRSVLRQDPDVIMVGEIRDAETATIAMQAATTGHLVLSTIHAQDTMGTLFRLRDLGVESYLMGSTLDVVLSQRLARQLCPHCKDARKPTDDEAKRLQSTGDVPERIHVPVGCQRCFDTGYAGRRAIFEMLRNTGDVRDLILGSPNVKELREALKETDFRPLRAAGHDLVREGASSLEEVERVVGQ